METGYIILGVVFVIGLAIGIFGLRQARALKAQKGKKP